MAKGFQADICWSRVSPVAMPRRKATRALAVPRMMRLMPHPDGSRPSAAPTHSLDTLQAVGSVSSPGRPRPPGMESQARGGEV